MPLNTLRLNHQPSSHPNERIVFIKPISRPPTQRDDFERAELVLRAIAAQCLPIMKGHHLSVTTLEEYEPNPEFIGRNFNNGEIIQLVIKSKSGAWLPLNMIQMVMMHELAHNTHMNHGKGFWQARNLYADEMRGLWSRGYTGEGVWGQGRALRSLESALGGNMLRSEELADLPLCGGTFRSRQKKRKVKDGSDLTWKEKRDKRIEKKFGKNGEKLGENEDARMMLELNRKGSLGGKPRVAQSKRGRELRAAAALARFETNKKESKEQEKSVTDDDETESETEYEEVECGQEEAKDSRGRKIMDSNGRSMVRVCKEEGGDDLEVKRELQELAELDNIPHANETGPSREATASPEQPDDSTVLNTNLEAADEVAPDRSTTEGRPNASGRTLQSDRPSPQSAEIQHTTSEIAKNASASPGESVSTGRPHDIQCPICSMTNDTIRLSCIACAHVLDPRKDTRSWKCSSVVCKDGVYINAGDCGICGVCGIRKRALVPTKAWGRERDSGGVGSSAHIAYL